MKTIFLTVICIITLLSVQAQVGIGTTTPHASAILELKDSTKGILIPRLTMLQRNAIANPAEGLMVYQKDSTKGYWYFDGTQWKNISALSSTSSNFGGKTVITLTDTITNVQAAAKIAAEVGPYTQEIKILGCTSLTYVDLSMITSAVDVLISSNKYLATVNLSGLKYVAGHFYIENCPGLINVDVSSLKKVIFKEGIPTNESAISISMNSNLSTLNFPSLQTVVGNISLYKNKLSNVSFPVLTGEVAGLWIELNTTMTSFSMPNLTYIQDLIILNNPILTSLNFPALTRFSNPLANYGLMIQGNANLTSLTFGSLTSILCPSLMINAKLPSSNVNGLLAQLVSISPPLTGKSIYLTQIPAAPPTGQGLIDKATLISQSNSVATN